MKNYVFISILFLLSSCSDDIIKIGNPIPQISFVSLSKNEIISFKDELEIKIKYQDGDGDLGSFEADSLDIFVKDSRLKAFDTYHLPPLAPKNANVRIEGEFNLKLKTLFILSRANSEYAFFEIYVKDRAGHKSNTVVTPNVHIVRP